MSKHYTVKSVDEAWSKANEIIPCDYIHDSERSRNAGYDIYFSTCPSIVAWISDLGDRLEVNLPNGESVNVWIEDEDTAERATDAAEVAQMRKDAEAIQNGKYEAIYAPTVGQLVTVCVNGDTYASEAERGVYDALRHDHAGAAADIVAKWCDQHGLLWGTIKPIDKQHIAHGNGTGHYVVSAFVSARCGNEPEFLQACAALLMEEYTNNARTIGKKA